MRTASIVICNHNHGRYLPQAVASAMGQTVACEVIVVDDGSSDGSRDWLARELARADPRVQVLLQPQLGQLAACNAGFARCSGDIVLFLDADDVLLPQAVERALAAFADGVAKVHFRLAVIDEAGAPMGPTLPGTLASGDVGRALVRHGLLYPSPPGSGNAYGRSVLDTLFPLPLDAHDLIAADFFLIYGAAAFGTVAACDEVLGHYRLHRQAKTGDQTLVFGNAAVGNDEAAKVATRYARLRAWLLQRSGGRVQLAAEYLDFSVQKTPYAQAVLSRSGWIGQGLAARLGRLLTALWLQPAYGWRKRVALSAWAVLLLMTPRTTAMRLARHVCNPGSRTA